MRGLVAKTQSICSKIDYRGAMYARVWENVPDTTQGLYQSGKFKASVAFKNFDKFFAENKEFKTYFDETSQAPYQYSSKEKQFATYDDARSIKAKTQFIKDKKLGGIMFWELSNDKSQGGLVDDMFENLNKHWIEYFGTRLSDIQNHKSDIVLPPSVFYANHGLNSAEGVQ